MVEAATIIIVFLLILGALVIGIPIALYIRKRNYIKSLTDRGWVFIDAPSTRDIAELGVPPFGREFDRSVDDLARGQASNGAWFQCFDYRTGEFNGRVLTVRMPVALPELHIVNGPRPRSGVTTAPFPGYEPLLVTGSDPTFARQLLTEPVLAAIANYGNYEVIDLTIDGNHLTATYISSREPDVIARAADLLAAIVDTFPPHVMQHWQQPDPPHTFRFYQHPDWQYEPRRDELLDSASVTTGGHSHRTEHVVTSNRLPFVAFIHHWCTTEHYTTTDSNGRTQHHTRTVHHQENILEFSLPFTSPELFIGPDQPSWIRALLGRLPVIDFESEHFNRVFDVHCASPRFAYDVLHPRQLEYLLATRPTSFSWGNGRAHFDLPIFHTELIARNVDFFCGFLQRVPSFVWKDLQLPIPEMARGSSEPPPRPF